MADRKGDLEIVEPVARPWEERPEFRGGYASRIPDEIREAAVERAFEVGVRRTAKEFGIEERTIHFLIKELGDEHRDLWNEKTSRKLEEKMEKVLARIDDKTINGAKLRDLAITLGVLADKREQFAKSRMRGEATARLRIAWKDGSGAMEIETGG